MQVKCQRDDDTFSPSLSLSLLWPRHVWVRKTISSDIIDVTDVVVIKLSVCEGPPSVTGALGDELR